MSVVYKCSVSMPISRSSLLSILNNINVSTSRVRSWKLLGLGALAEAARQ
jgi:hypothetical protein